MRNVVRALCLVGAFACATVAVFGFHGWQEIWLRMMIAFGALGCIEGYLASS